jgi:hypothetical protein
LQKKNQKKKSLWFFFFGLLSLCNYHLRKKKASFQKPMGTNISTEVNKTINEAVNEQTIDAQQKMVSQNSQSVNVNQKVELVLGPGASMYCGGVLEINQEGTVSMQSLSIATQEQKVNMAQLVSQALESTAKTAMEQENKDLSILQTEVATVINEAINRSKSVQEISMIQEFETIISQQSDVNQSIIIKIGEQANLYIASDCKFTQKSSIEYTAQMTTSAAIDAVLRQEGVQEAITEWDTAIKQSNKGLSLPNIIVIVVVVIVVIIAIALMAKFLPPYIAKKKAAAAAQKAAKTSA